VTAREVLRVLLAFFFFFTFRFNALINLKTDINATRAYTNATPPGYTRPLPPYNVENVEKLKSTLFAGRTEELKFSTTLSGVRGLADYTEFIFGSELRTQRYPR
jgi:hypothetical protein